MPLQDNGRRIAREHGIFDEISFLLPFAIGRRRAIAVALEISAVSTRAHNNTPIHTPNDGEEAVGEALSTVFSVLCLLPPPLLLLHSIASPSCSINTRRRARDGARGRQKKKQHQQSVQFNPKCAEQFSTMYASAPTSSRNNSSLSHFPLLLLLLRRLHKYKMLNGTLNT